MSNDIQQAEDFLKQLCLKNVVEWVDNPGFLPEQLLDLMAQHGLAPLINYLLSNETASWPQEILKTLKNNANSAVTHDMLTRLELARVLDALAAEGIRPILIKGSPLSYLLYPRIGLRPRCDTDLLLAKEGYLKAVKVIKSLGYQTDVEDMGDLVSSAITFYRFDPSGFSHVLDIHWKISSHHPAFSDALHYDALTKNTLVVPGLGKNARTLGTIDALLLASFHRAVHISYTGERAIWLYDIHLLAERLSEQEFKLFFQCAKDIGIEALCSDALENTQQWFNTRLFKSVIARMECPPSDEVTASFLCEGRESGIKMHALTELEGLTSAKDKLRYIAQKIFPPRSFMMKHYNLKYSGFLPFYYVYRIFYGLYVVIIK